jgi:hypothetical protein
VQIYSRNDKSTRRKWWKYCRVSTCSRKRDLKPAFGKCLGAGTHSSRSRLFDPRGLCSYARWLQQRAHTLDHGEHLLANIDFGLRKGHCSYGRSVEIARRLQHDCKEQNKQNQDHQNHMSNM